jgi:hypothetical protein
VPGNIHCRIERGAGEAPAALYFTCAGAATDTRRANTIQR